LLWSLSLHFFCIRHPPTSTLFPYTTLFRSRSYSLSESIFPDHGYRPHDHRRFRMEYIQDPPTDTGASGFYRWRQANVRRRAEAAHRFFHLCSGHAGWPCTLWTYLHRISLRADSTRRRQWLWLYARVRHRDTACHGGITDGGKPTPEKARHQPSQVQRGN